MLHSNIVGGSTAKRVIACPASVQMVAAMPPQINSEFASKGTLLHDTIADVLSDKPAGIGSRQFDNITLTQDMYDDKVGVALALLDEVDPHKVMEYEVEQLVSFGDFLPGVFGSTDLIGRIGDRAIVLDWKFGDGVAVEAEENYQGLFYAAAGSMTEATKWAFAGATEVEIIIVQPPSIKRWVTTPQRVESFKFELSEAVKQANKPGARIQHGDHCRFCRAKPVCPKMTGAMERALRVSLENLNPDTIGAYLKNADLLEQWITDLRALSHQMLENGVAVPGYKLVAKRATRKWVDESKAAEALLLQNVPRSDIYVEELLSPAQMEKVLKKRKMVLPPDLTVAISSGTTVVPESDPRSPVVQLAQQLTAALSKIV